MRLSLRPQINPHLDFAWAFHQPVASRRLSAPGHLVEAGGWAAFVAKASGLGHGLPLT